MLSMVANELAGDTSYASVSLLAQDIGGEAKVEVITPEVADAFIQVKLGFDRAWASVLYSANRGGYTLIDHNRSEGILYVNFSAPSDDQPGFFKRWFGGGSEEILRLTTGFWFRMGNNVEVRIVGPSSEGLDRAETLRLLTILRGNMSRAAVSCALHPWAAAVKAMPLWWNGEIPA